MKRLRTWQKQLFTVLASMLVVFLMFLSIYFFIQKVENNERIIADENMLTAADNGVKLIQTVFSDYSTNIKNIAALYEKNDNIISDESLGMLARVAKQSGYNRLAVDFPDGSTYTTDGDVFNMSSFGYLEKIKRGESFITDVIPAIIDNTNVISFLSPLHNEKGEPIAALRLTMETSLMAEVIDLTLFNSEGYYHLVDENGKYVAAGESDNALLMNQNFFDAVAAMDYDKGYSKDNIKKAFTTGESGFVRYSIAGSKRFAHCQPVNINNWVLMTIVPQEVITKAERQNISFAIVMTIQLAIILFIAFIYIYLAQRGVRKTAILNDKCFRALAEQTSKVIFEWDFSSGRIVAMNNFKELFGREMVTRNSALEALNLEMVHPEDKMEFKRVFDTILGGKNIDSIRFRVKHASGEYHWCELSGIVVFDHGKHPYKAIGSLEDINALVINEEQMKRKSETDQLTGLYNKTSTEQRIRRALSEGDGSFALLIIDIDNFKTVNDSLGHQFGDRVLVELADILKQYSCELDVVGRIGGDEFFLFFGDCKDERLVYESTENICRKFERTYYENGTNCKVSVSIGISFSNKDGDDFNSLYRCADVALYRRKATGKNGYTVYDKSFGSGVTVSLRTKIDNDDRKNSI